jgi:hypothetical protein
MNNELYYCPDCKSKPDARGFTLPSKEPLWDCIVRTGYNAALARTPLRIQGDAKPYAYEYGKANGDGTYSVVIERGDMVKVSDNEYVYGPPKRAVKDWPIKHLYLTAPAQAGDARDAARLDWLNQNFFSDQKDEWDERLAPDSIKWKFFGPMSVQGDVRRVIDAAMSAFQGKTGGEA